MITTRRFPLRLEISTVPSIKVVLADDHAVVRAGISSILNSLGGIEIVGQASNGRDALELVAQHQPNLLLCDISMPEMNGLETTTRVVKEFPEVRVIILSMHMSEEYVWQALNAGASGYLLKDAEAVEIEIAINAALKGETYLSPSVSKQVVNNYMQRMGSESTVADALTPRQREILQLIAEGKTTKEIAMALGIGIKTVETHRAMLMERLNLHDIASLVRYAIRKGFISAET